MAGPDVTDDQPTVFVLEGVTGDLAKRMVPAGLIRPVHAARRLALTDTGPRSFLSGSHNDTPSIWSARMPSS